jgi:hypothetical protein
MTEINCTHQDHGFCARCPIPLHAVQYSPTRVVQYADADAAVTAMRANYDTNGRKVRDEFLARVV